jgi:hypothetical protein
MTVLSTGSLDGNSTARLIRGLGGRLTAAICVASADVYVVSHRALQRLGIDPKREWGVQTCDAKRK